MKTEKDRIFQVESKIRQAKLDDKTRRENRNRKVSYLLTEKVDCKIGIVGVDDNQRPIWGSVLSFETDDGTFTTTLYGKTKNSADTLVRTFLDKIGVKYRITRGE